MKKLTLIFFMLALLNSCKNNGNNSTGNASALAADYCDCWTKFEASDSSEELTRCQQKVQDQVLNLSSSETYEYAKAVDICNAQFIDRTQRNMEEELKKSQSEPSVY